MYPALDNLGGGGGTLVKWGLQCYRMWYQLIRD